MREAHAHQLGRLLKSRDVELARMQQGSAWQAPAEGAEDDIVKAKDRLARIPRHHFHYVLLAAELGAIARQLGDTEVFCAAYVSAGGGSPNAGPRTTCYPIVVFFYLTDVLPGDGGLIVLPGSHKALLDRPKSLLVPDLASPGGRDPAVSELFMNLCPRGAAGLQRPCHHPGKML